MKLFKSLFAGLIFLVLLSCSSEDENANDDMESSVLSALEGSWVLAKEAGAMAVGPDVGSADWWFNTEEDILTRSCLFNDVWTFQIEPDLAFLVSVGGLTWKEPWQGVMEEGCGSPVSPYDGKTRYSFEVTNETITVIGSGAYIGLPKAFNGGELSDGVSEEPDSRTYNILEFQQTSPKRLKLDMPVAGEGHWTFILTEG